MVLRRLVPAVVLLGAVACSGAADSDLLGPASSGTSPPSDASSRGADSPSAAKGGAQQTGAPASVPTAAPTPAPAPTGTQAPPPPPGDPPAACTPEAEPNDGLQRATPFTSSICGVVDKSIDVDFVEIEAPPNAHKLKFQATETTGRLSYRIFEDGGLRVQNAPASTTLTVDPGSTYAIRVTAGQIGLDKIPYEIKVSFEP